LLGRTRNNKLCTFTGKSEPDVHNPSVFEAPAVTAAREFTEESLGAIIGYEQCLELCRMCDNDHVMVSTTPKQTLCYTFLMEVPYRRYYSTCFAKTRAFLDFLDLREYHYLREFVEIKGVCFETLNNKIRFAWRSSGMIASESEWHKVQRLMPTTPPQCSEPLYEDEVPPGLAQRSYRIAPPVTYAHAAAHGTNWRTRVHNFERPQLTTHRHLSDDHSDEDVELNMHAPAVTRT